MVGGGRCHVYKKKPIGPSNLPLVVLIPDSTSEGACLVVMTDDTPERLAHKSN